MSAPKLMLAEFPSRHDYRVSSTDEILTPALILYPEIIASNIENTLQLLGGNAERWRVHIKTAKLAYTLRMFVGRGVRNFKCATTLELLVACRSGAADVLLAYPVMGANALRARDIAAEFPHVRVSALIENENQLHPWRGGKVGIFVDVNSGMNRTGIEPNRSDDIVRLVRAIRADGLAFRGLHFYDGHLGGTPEPERTAVAHAGYGSLTQLFAELARENLPVPEIITSGTPSFPCALSYSGFRSKDFVHRVSPGTVVYNDATSLAQLPADFGYRPAALVMARVVSRPRAGIVTCDAGHKTVSADAGVPTCIVLGHPELTPLAPSEEHLPFAVKDGAAGPQVGETLFLLPRHVCPTVNNFDDAVLVRDGQVISIEAVSARGREHPLAKKPEQVTTARWQSQQAADRA